MLNDLIKYFLSLGYTKAQAESSALAEMQRLKFSICL